MKIVSWNLARNTTSKAWGKHEEAWRYLASMDPDVALLQEVELPSWAAERWSIVAAPSAPWGSAILARPGLPLHAGQVDWDGGFRQGVLLATAELSPAGGPPTVLGSVHTVVWSKRDETVDELLAQFGADAVRRPRERLAYANDVAYAVFRQRVHGRRFIVSGDWNIARLWDEYHRGTHEADFFARAEEDGWVDCYRLFHEQEGRTWFRGRDIGYQLDHAFCDPETARLLTPCYIEPEPAERLKLSDHAPLVLEMQL
jgi:exonuclease III